MNRYAYYIFDATVADNALGSPVVDDAGAALGILQFTVNGEDVHSTDVAFLDTIALTGLSINNPVLSQSGIRVDLPKDKEQASLMLMMAAEKSDSMQYAKYVDAFISQFPQAVDGYTASAQTRMAANDGRLLGALAHDLPEGGVQHRHHVHKVDPRRRHEQHCQSH